MCLHVTFPLAGLSHGFPVACRPGFENQIINQERHIRIAEYGEWIGGIIIRYVISFPGLYIKKGRGCRQLATKLRAILAYRWGSLGKIFQK